MVTKERIAISLVLTIPVALTIFILKKPQQDSIPKELAIPTVLNKSSPVADRLTSPSKEEIEQRSNTSGVTPLSAASYFQHYITLDPSEQKKLLQKLRMLALNDLTTNRTLITEFSILLAEQNPLDALKFMNSFNFSDPAIRSLEKEVLSRCINEHFDTTTDYFIQQATENYARPSRHLKMMAELYKSEHSEQLIEWESWVNSLKGEALNSLQQSAVLGFVESDLTPEHLDTAKAVLDLNKDNWKLWSLYGIVTAQEAEENPQGALEWLNTQSAGPWRDMSLPQLFSALGHSHPEMALEWLNSDFLANLYLPYEMDEAGVPRAVQLDPDTLYEELGGFKDELIEEFLRSTMSENPSLAYESAAAFSDPALKEEYQEMALNLINADLLEEELEEQLP